MKKFWQIYLLLFLLFFIYDWNFNEYVKDTLKNITYEMRDIEEELDDIHEEIENLPTLHTRSNDVGYYTYDSEEQIQEEIREGEMEMLAQLIEAEAGNQDFKGKCLVADVVLNRVDNALFPNSVEEVIMEYHVRESDNEKCYQFATVKYGTYDDAGWYISDDSFKAAYQEYNANQRIDSNILYFTAGGYNSYCTPAYKYGDHYFGY